VVQVAATTVVEPCSSRRLGDLWPVYLANFVSFATVGAVWFAHTVITEYLHHADSVLLRLNLLLLLMVSFLAIIRP
jgi:uncharacterized membrane protein